MQFEVKYFPIQIGCANQKVFYCTMHSKTQFLRNWYWNSHLNTETSIHSSKLKLYYQ